MVGLDPRRADRCRHTCMCTSCVVVATRARVVVATRARQDVAHYQAEVCFKLEDSREEPRARSGIQYHCHVTAWQRDAPSVSLYAHATSLAPSSDLLSLQQRREASVAAQRRPERSAESAYITPTILSRG